MNAAVAVMVGVVEEEDFEVAEAETSLSLVSCKNIESTSSFLK